MRPRRLRLAPLVLLLGFALSSVLVADTVRLKNGRVFEEVIATVRGDAVELRLGVGSLTLPLSQVESMTVAATALAEYETRERALDRRPEATAGDWLELARWAQREALEFGVRRAALRAAELDPRAQGVAALLVRSGYAFDESAGEWLPIDEAMRRKGFREIDGEWISAEEWERRERVASDLRESEARAADERRDDRIAALAEQALVASLARSDAPPLLLWAQPNPVLGWGWPMAPPLFVPLPGPLPGVDPGPPAPPPVALPPASHRGASPNGLARRQPGSLIPVDGD